MDKIGKLELHNCDNMELMAKYPDNYFDLAVVDPEYGIGESSKNHKSRNTPVRQKNGKLLKSANPTYQRKKWDNERPKLAYFNELRRISKKQIIWGGNYFADFLPENPGRLIWDKINGDNDFSDCEIAWTNLFDSTRIVRYMWAGMMQGKTAGVDILVAAVQQGNKKLNEKRIHPTQKPVALYNWIYEKYAKPGFKILYTHLGSGSNAIAAHYSENVAEFVACELDKDYYTDMLKRVKEQTAQLKLF